MNPMLDLGVVTVFPEMFEAVTGYGITGQAVKRGLLRLRLWNPRDYALDARRNVDDRPYGGGPGMVMSYAPLRGAIDAARESAEGAGHVVYLTPQGRRLDQAAAGKLAEQRGLVLVCGRYEGVDERLIAGTVDEEWSIGDYVLSGGELAAMVVIDALTRLVPGVLGHDDSATEDSFMSGLLDYPHYTRPEEVDGKRVPAVLLGGNHAAIRRWRLKQALGRTWRRRPDLLETATLDEEQIALLNEYLAENELAGETPASASRAKT